MHAHVYYCDLSASLKSSDAAAAAAAGGGSVIVLLFDLCRLQIFTIFWVRLQSSSVDTSNWVGQLVTRMQGPLDHAILRASADSSSGTTEIGGMIHRSSSVAEDSGIQVLSNEKLIVQTVTASPFLAFIICFLRCITFFTVIDAT